MKFGHIPQDSRPHCHRREPTNRKENDEDAAVRTSNSVRNSQQTHLRYKDQAVKAVERSGSCLVTESYGTYTYTEWDECSAVDVGASGGLHTVNNVLGKVQDEF